MLRISAITLSACLSIAGPATAQMATKVAETIRTVEFAGRTPSTYWAITKDDLVEGVSVYFEPFQLPSAWDGSTAPRWVARRSAWPQGIEGVVQWTDSHSCPALAGVLWGLKHLPPPELEVHGIERPVPGEGAPRAMLASGPVEVTVGGFARQFSRHPGTVQWTALGAPAGAWGEAAIDSLSNCWTDNPPRR